MPTSTPSIRNMNRRTTRRPHARAGFTLIEVMLAAMITAFVLGSVTVSVSQLGRVKETSKLRLDAHLRAEHAINALRRDVASVIRHQDLFWTRLLIRQGTAHSPIGELARDEILVFNTRLSAIQDLDFHGEGMQYETQYRIEETHHGTMLWQRRDAVPDEFPLAGGIATPLADGVIVLMLEAYDGWEWVSNWDSDEQGLPRAVRITVAASGARNGEELYEGPIAKLRTVVPIDRVLPPIDQMRPTEEELDELLAEVEDVADRSVRARAEDSGGRGGASGRSIRGDGSRPAAGAPASPPGSGGQGLRRPGTGHPPSQGSPSQRPQVWTRGSAGAPQIRPTFPQ